MRVVSFPCTRAFYDRPSLAIPTRGHLPFGQSLPIGGFANSGARLCPSVGQVGVYPLEKVSLAGTFSIRAQGMSTNGKARPIVCSCAGWRKPINGAGEGKLVVGRGIL